MAERKRHEPMTLTAGEVALLCDMNRGRSDDEADETAEDLLRCMPVFVPLADREAAVERFRRLGLLP